DVPVEFVPELTMEELSGSRYADEAPFSGGAAFTTPRGGTCTTGFGVYRCVKDPANTDPNNTDKTSEYLITAAHCGTERAAVTTGAGPGSSLPYPPGAGVALGVFGVKPKEFSVDLDVALIKIGMSGAPCDDPSSCGANGVIYSGNTTKAEVSG